MMVVLFKKKLTWDVNRKFVYRDLVPGVHLNDQFQDIFNDWASSSLSNSQATDDLAKRFTEVIYNVAEPLFPKPISDVRERKHIKRAWMNQECKIYVIISFKR